MQPSSTRPDLIQQLRKDILSLENGRKPAGQCISGYKHSLMAQAFPGRVFPTSAVHELLSFVPEDAAATNGFITALLSSLVQHTGMCLWISNKRTLFPPAIRAFGVQPDRIIFIDLTKDKDVLWTVEQALKCTSLAAVIGELKELSFTESRRLQLAVEQSGMSAFIHRHQPKQANTVACTARWKVTALPSMPEEGMPGIGYPRWEVSLARVRNGKPGIWQVEWRENAFHYLGTQVVASTDSSLRKAV